MGDNWLPMTWMHLLYWCLLKLGVVDGSFFILKRTWRLMWLAWIYLLMCTWNEFHCVSAASTTGENNQNIDCTVAAPHVVWCFNTLRPRQNGHHFADDVFKYIFLNENAWILLQISLKFALKCLINNISSLVQIMAWRRPGDKPLSEQMMVSLLTHICVVRPQWVKTISTCLWCEHHYRSINSMATTCH